MEDLNIPICRAKKIDSDEYIIGNLLNGRFIFIEWIDDAWCGYSGGKRSNKALVQEIDPATLAINFEGMIDSEGNKIFASLSKDGRGGDLFQHEDNWKAIFTYDSFNGLMAIIIEDFTDDPAEKGELVSMMQFGEPKHKVIGIQE